jgi:hypothetical protein
MEASKMSKKFLLVFLLIVCAFTFHKIHESPKVEVENPISLTDNASLWKYQSHRQQFQMILTMFELSNGAARMYIVNGDSALQEGSKYLIDISDCVDSSCVVYYYEFNKDVEIGSVIINCFSRLGMLSN